MCLLFLYIWRLAFVRQLQGQAKGGWSMPRFHRRTTFVGPGEGGRQFVCILSGLPLDIISDICAPAENRIWSVVFKSKKFMPAGICQVLASELAGGKKKCLIVSPLRGGLLE